MCDLFSLPISSLSPSTFPPSLYNKLDGGQGGGAEGSPRDEEATVWRLLRDKINCNAASGNGSVGLKYWRTDATYGTCISARICSSRKKGVKTPQRAVIGKKEALYQPSFLFYPSTLFMQSARRRPNGVPKGNVIQCWVMCNNCIPHEAHHSVLDRLREKERERLNALLLRITSSRMSSSPHESYTLSSQKDMAPKPQYNLKV